MTMLNWCMTTKKRVVLCLNPTMTNANLGFRVYDWHRANWQLLGNSVLISNSACITGLDHGMRAELATVPGTDNVVLLADSSTNRLIGRMNFAANGSLTIRGDMNSAVGDIPYQMPMVVKHKVAGVLAVNGLLNITIVDLVNGYDEDILRYKHAAKGVFVPVKYMSPTPAVDVVDQGSLPLAPESQAGAQNRPEEPITEEVASTFQPLVDEQVHVAALKPVNVEPSDIVSTEPVQAPTKPEPSFDEWADVDTPLALRPSTGHAKSSSTEGSDIE